MRMARALVALLLAAATARAGSFVTFESGQVRPLALSPDGGRLFAVNTPDGRLEIFDIGPAGLEPAGSVAVGLEPVAVAARSDGEVWVVNHLSDSVSVVDVAATPPRVTRTLLVGDEPRDIVFAGPGRGRAFVTTAHRGQSTRVDPQLTTPGVGRGDVWVFDAAAPGPDPLAIVTLFSDTPRALAVSPDGATVWAASFQSGNQTTVVSEGAVCDGTPDVTCEVDGIPMPGGLPPPTANVEGVPGPDVGLVVSFDPATGAWRDSAGRDWRNAIRMTLPDTDVFAIDAFATPPAQTAAFAHVGTVIYGLTVNPATGAVYAANTEARNQVRFAGAGILGGSSVRGRLHESRVTVIEGGEVRPVHLNPHIDYGVVPSPPGTAERSLATPAALAVRGDGSTLYVAALGSSTVGVLDVEALEAGNVTPDPSRQWRVPGGGPTGLALDEPRGRLYVLARFANAVDVLDATTGAALQQVLLYNPEPPSVVAGRPFLYDAALGSSNGEQSCATCHVFGDVDALAWDLGDPDGVVTPNPNPIRGSILTEAPDFHPMKGPLTTQTLRGTATHGAMHWRGDRTGGLTPGVDPRDERAAFLEFNGAFADLLGRTGPLSTAQMEAFADFVLADHVAAESGARTRQHADAGPATGQRPLRRVPVVPRHRPVAGLLRHRRFRGDHRDEPEAGDEGSPAGNLLHQGGAVHDAPAVQPGRRELHRSPGARLRVHAQRQRRVLHRQSGDRTVPSRLRSQARADRRTAGDARRRECRDGGAARRPAAGACGAG